MKLEIVQKLHEENHPSPLSERLEYLRAAEPQTPITVTGPRRFPLGNGRHAKQPGLAAGLGTGEPGPRGPALVIAVAPRFTQLQVISESVHELVAALRPAGSVGQGWPAAVGLRV